VFDFLYIDTPEVHPVEEPLGKEAADFTCNMLKNADSIYIEYDGERVDQYDRVLGWIWVDDLLLQEELTKKGYVDYFFEYNQPKYRDRILRAFQEAKKNKVGLFR
jgi:micrococcal nuclease